MHCLGFLDDQVLQQGLMLISVTLIHFCFIFGHIIFIIGIIFIICRLQTYFNKFMPKPKHLNTWLQIRKHEKAALAAMTQESYQLASIHLNSILRLDHKFSYAYLLLAAIQRRTKNQVGVQRQAQSQIKDQTNMEKQYLKYAEEFTNRKILVQDQFSPKSEEEQTLRQNQIVEALTTRSQKIEPLQDKVKSLTQNDRIFSTLSEISDIYQQFHGDSSGAEALLNAALQIFETEKMKMDFRGLNHLGIVCYSLGFYEKGFDLIKHKFILKNETRTQCNNLAILSYIRKEYELGRVCVEKSLGFNRQHSRVYYIRSFIEMKTGKFQAALEHISYSIQKEPRTVFYQFKKLCIIGFFLLKGSIQEPEKVVKMCEEFQQTLQSTIKIMMENLDNDKNLLPSQFSPAATSSVLFINQFYHKLGVNGLKHTLFESYLLHLDNFLIFGRLEKGRAALEMNKMEKVIRQSLMV